ncbi:hypothetical protein ANN_20781 [Periplaneta americana]|uniref:Uncharacterized protein n=1 Tax=Periplaneta americana TaxID=6978 RepID=A0ABQ8SEN9_PERAM|nr:hypothetical protein ANN_20781 [Periplaneta americana]
MQRLVVSSDGSFANELTLMNDSLLRASNKLARSLRAGRSRGSFTSRLSTSSQLVSRLPLSNNQWHLMHDHVTSAVTLRKTEKRDEGIELRLFIASFSRVHGLLVGPRSTVESSWVATGELDNPSSQLFEVYRLRRSEALTYNIKDNFTRTCYYSVEKLLSSSLLSKNVKVRIYKTVILPVVLYGCKTWTLTLREEHRLRVLENKVLRKIFGAKRDEVTGEWRKLHNTELHALYSLPDIIRNIKSRRLRWAGHVARKGESRNAYRVLVGRPEGKRPLGRPRRRWEDNIKMDLREVGYDDRERINLVQDRDQWRAYVRAAMDLRVPLKPVTNLAAVRSVPGRSLDGTRCRHGCPEIETLAHVLGFCEQGLFLRNSRHHLVRSKIAAALRNKGWIVEEEISCLAENGLTRRVDILAYNADTKQGIIVDPMIRFEVECHQSAEVHLEKKSIYEPTVNYFKLKYALIHVEVFGLLIGARGNIPAVFLKNFDGSLLCQHLCGMTCSSAMYIDRLVPDYYSLRRMVTLHQHQEQKEWLSSNKKATPHGRSISIHRDGICRDEAEDSPQITCDSPYAWGNIGRHKLGNQFKQESNPYPRATPNRQCELIDLRCDREMRAKYGSKSSLMQFYDGFPRGRFPNLHKPCEKVLCLFGSTYRCEQLFSITKINKSQTRNDGLLTAVLRIACANTVSPNLEKLSNMN